MNFWLAKRPEQSPWSRMQQMMDEFWNTHPVNQAWGAEPLKNFEPKIDLKQKKNKVQVTAELPGLDEDDIEVEVDRDALLLHGEKKFEKNEDDDQGRHYYECSYGHFQRRIPLPYEVNLETVDAKFKNGVLKVQLEKAEPEKLSTRKIPIQSH